MKKKIFFIIISIFSKNMFSSWLNSNQSIEWAQEKDFFFKMNHEKEDAVDASDIEDEFSFKKIKRKLKINSSLERLENKKRALSLEKQRIRKFIVQNQIPLNHREMVGFMMRCSHEKYN